jgi:arylsulfatase A-like enzyme
METRSRPLPDALAVGALTGFIAAAAAGAIDAVWGWAPAGQFVPGFFGRLRFVAYTALSHAALGALAGVVLAAVIAAMAATRLGTLWRFAFGYHDKIREADRRDAVIGVSVAIALVPVLAAAIYIVDRATLPVVVTSHAKNLAVLVVIVATLAALAAVVLVAFALARPIELALRPLAARWRPVSSAWAPFVTAGVLAAIALGLWAWHEWDTVEQLHLRGAVVAAVALVLAIPARRPARRVKDFANVWRPALRRPVWAVLVALVPVLVLATGGSAGVIKAASAYTGLGGPVSRTLRKLADRDHDGYARWLGGGDCDDGNPSVHPGAPEIAGDGIDQNCIGGDAPKSPPKQDTAFAPVPASVPKDFDVLLITIDTTRADHLGMYGYQRPTSPNLDKLAADGTLFENGWAHAPSTRYSMPAILTGRLPLDVYYDYSINWPGLLPKATTIAELLGPLGFVTGALTNYDYFDRVRHFDQGFAEYDNSNARLHHGVAGAGPEQTKGSSSKEQADAAIAFVDRHAGERWFLWVHFYDPHYAYEPHPGQPSFGSDKEALYDGEIRYTDMHIGRLLDELRAKGLYDKTVVVVTGDHGEGFGEHDVLFHGYHLYSPQTKVPLVIRVPGIAPRRATTPAGHVDIIPTLVNLAGGQPTPDMMGRSLVDVIAGKDVDRTVFQQLSYEGNHEMRAGVDRHCHVVYNVSPETSWEVYRVDRDPLETEDLAGDDDACAATRRAVEAWYDASTVTGGAEVLAQRPPITAPLDADFLGARLLAIELPAVKKAGDTITVTWTWEARSPIAPGWKVFAHLDGASYVNADHAPGIPFEAWKPGQLIRYTTQLSLPRTPGHYTLSAGLWNGKARAQGRVKGAAADAVTMPIEVTP